MAPLTEFCQLQRSKNIAALKDFVCPKCGHEMHCNHGSFQSHMKACTLGEKRFWAKVKKTDSCWLYMGFRKWDGYGWLSRMTLGKPRYMTAHRYAWILTYGPIEEGMHVLHRCDNPPCCNPAHLRLGTHLDNMADMKEKGRSNGLHRKKPVLHPDRVRPQRKA